MSVLASPWFVAGGDPYRAERSATAALRVMHVVPALHSGGMERTMLRVVQALENSLTHRDTGRIVHGFCILQDADPTLLEQCRTLGWTHVLGNTQSPSETHSNRFAFLKLAKAMETFQPDVIHVRTTSIWADAMLAFKRARSWGNPRLLLSYHGKTTLEPQSIWRTMRDAPKRWAGRSAHAVMAVSQDSADMLEHQWHIPHPRLHVIANGVDVLRYHPVASTQERESIRHRLGIPTKAPVIVCVANLAPIKNHELLIRAFRQVATALPGVQLYCLGQGSMHDSLVNLADQLRLTTGQGCLHFVGSREDVPDWLRAADVFALPTRYEGCSNATLEAMASALPVVVSDLPAMREIVVPHATGILVEQPEPQVWARHLIDLLKDHKGRQQLGQRAHDCVTAYCTLSHTARRYAQLYQRLAQSASSKEVS